MPAVGIELLEVELGALEWAHDILWYLNDNEVLDSRKGVRKVRYQAARYVVVNGVLYRRGYNTTLLRCI